MMIAEMIKPEIIEIGMLAMAFSAAVRKEIINRQQHRCIIEGCDRQPLQCHHIIPSCQGGRDIADNGVAVCQYHHYKLDALAIREHIYYPEALQML